ncbi:metallophosphoesterase [Rhizobium herbae]
MLKIIPDIHADIDRLDRSLGVARDAKKIAFLGDLIDAGPNVEKPDDLAVLTRTRQLIDDGIATSVMGNHELNAILFHTLGNDGYPLRSHSDRNRHQHKTFLDRFGICTPEALEWTEWFASLPLWIEVKGLRLVHACWSEHAVSVIAARRPDGRLQPEDLAEVAQKSTPFGRAVQTIVCGPEVTLPQGFDFTDFGGHRRNQVRLAWWRSDALTWRETALSVPVVEELPPGELPINLKDEIYPENAPTVLVGHYKMTGVPRIESPRAASLDYPATPCIYVWQGEVDLTERNLIVL